MNSVISDKINILKAIAIALVVSGHLEFSIFGMFPPYSFQLALFFFISGMLFKDKYLDNVQEFIKRRVKSLLVPYFLYSAFYCVLTVVIFKLTGKFWGMDLSFKNFFITPFLNGHQFDLSCPLWFVPQLFITMMCFLFLERVMREKSELFRAVFIHFQVLLQSLCLKLYRSLLYFFWLLEQYFRFSLFISDIFI